MESYTDMNLDRRNSSIKSILLKKSDPRLGYTAHRSILL